MKNIKKLVITLLLGALTLSVFAFTGCKTSQEETSNNDNVDVGIAVLASYEETTATGEKSLFQLLRASIAGDLERANPVDLEWTVNWEHPNNEDINNYIILEPEGFVAEGSSEGVSACGVRLIGPLSNTAIITVRCKNNNCFAKCYVEYDPWCYGAKFTTTDKFTEYEDDNIYNDDYNNLVFNFIAGNTYTFDFEYLGYFGEVLTDFPESLIGYTATYGYEFELYDSNNTFVDNINYTQYETFWLEDFITYNGEINNSNDKYQLNTYADITVDYELKKIVITAMNPPSKLEAKIVEDADGKACYRFDSYLDLNVTPEPFVTIYHDYDSVNGITFRVFDELSISLNKNYIVFS